MTLSIKSLHAQFGATITGIDLTQAIDESLAQTLRQCLADHAVLVFPRQGLNPSQFQAFGEVFGELMPQQFKKYTLDDFPFIGFNSTHDLPRKNGKLQVRGENYHTDHSNELCPPRATSLVAVEIPSVGGDTQFVDVRQAYDDLDQALKEKIKGLYSMHVLQSSRSPRSFTQLSAEEKAAIPNHLQPLVIEHPVSGRSALYLNTGRMEGVQGMPEEEGFALINDLYAHATQSQYEYRHRWQVGDVVIWDNRSVMHQANADYDPEEFRYLYRLMVKGDALKAAQMLA